MGERTPGPWVVVPYGDGDSLVICKDEAGEQRIAFMATPGCRDSADRKKKWREIRANARLIAAAPELVAAAIYAREVLAPHKDDDFAWSAISQLTAALAKAGVS